MGQSLGITSSVPQAAALNASAASTYISFKTKYDQGKKSQDVILVVANPKFVLLIEKRVQCHIQATNKFPTKLGLIIERA